MMSRGILVRAALFCLLLAAQPALAADWSADQAAVQAADQPATPSADMGEVEVTAQPLVTPTRQTGETVYTGEEITRKGMELQGSRTATGVYESLGILPGISVEAADPMGLAAEQRSIRVRGVRGYLGSLSVAGVPNYGGNPIGPRDYLYDMENIDSVSVYKGTIPADLGTGVGARGGAIELTPRWPSRDFAAEISQSFGSFDYHRSFARIDSGAISGTGTGLSLSYSYTDADKWKGPGDLGPRNNLNFMVEQPYTDKDRIQLLFNFNDVDSQHLFRPLTYAEASNLSANYRKDYNEKLTGVRSQDINYFESNRADFDNKDLLAVIPYSIGDHGRVLLKPYYSKEDSEILQGVSSQGGLIQKRLRDIERYGTIAEGSYDFQVLKATLGYLFESSSMSINTQNYNPSTMQFLGGGVITRSDDNGIVHSPYLKLAGNLGQFDWQAGLKYFSYRDPSIQGFTTGPAPTYAPVRAADLDRTAKTYDAVLPTAGLGYTFCEAWQVHASYGRSQIRPYAYVPLINTYNTNRARFQAAGVSLNDLFQGLDMEISDNVELGARYHSERFEVLPTVWYSRQQDLLVNVSDARVTDASGKPVSYQQNVGKATGYGFELENNVFVTEALTAFVNPSYTVLTYDDDIVYQGAVFKAKDNQLVDAPRWLVKSGVIFRHGSLEVTPQARYVGDRYGDAAHQEKIGDYMTADLLTSYTFKDVGLMKALKTSLEFYNLLDRQYISSITASDDARGGDASYLAGAPFTVLGKVSMEF